MIQPEMQEELKNIYTKGNITLFLGAGVPAVNGSPNWNELYAILVQVCRVALYELP
jgi:hypothetical protein